MEQKSKPAQKWLVPALLIIIIALLAALLFMRSCQAEPDITNISDNATPTIGYAEGVTVVEDPEALQKLVDEMYQKAAEGTIALEYKNEAFSADGTNFSCYIANSVDNRYDMYIQIFADQELTDQLLLTGLIRPGSAFDNIELEHALDVGTHRVYVAFTQVEEDLATIHAQVFVTMDFTVSK